ncbi:MAG: DNA gyrase inhibitor YacG [Rhizobiaceae bacterium]|nr:DNA gyrase inhibitor YacG [Rhizobiaceae bacterium]MCV0405952.1 DNA gyrase inhibitor YacG [Rhizobiaceae bacterium]
MAEADNVTPLRPRRPCPECGKPSTRENFPFCSPRCKAIDLNRWFSGAYVIPATEEEAEGDQDQAERRHDDE